MQLKYFYTTTNRCIWGIYKGLLGITQLVRQSVYISHKRNSFFNGWSDTDKTLHKGSETGGRQSQSELFQGR